MTRMQPTSLHTRTARSMRMLRLKSTPPTTQPVTLWVYMANTIAKGFHFAAIWSPATTYLPGDRSAMFPPQPQAMRHPTHWALRDGSYHSSDTDHGKVCRTKMHCMTTPRCVLGQVRTVGKMTDGKLLQCQVS